MDRFLESKKIKTLDDAYKSSRMAQVYVDKANNSKYVDEARLRITPLYNASVKKFTQFVELLKKVNVRSSQEAEFTEKRKTWEAQYPTSTPTLGMKKSIVFMTELYAEYKWPIDFKPSAASVAQAFNDEIQGAGSVNFFVSPLAQSLHYSRAFYMVFNYDVMRTYAYARNKASILVTKHCLERGIFTVEELRETSFNRKKISEKLRNGWDLLDFADAELTFEMRKDLLSNLDFENVAQCAVAAYPVSFLRLTQCRDIRAQVAPPSVYNHIKLTNVFLILKTLDYQELANGAINLAKQKGGDPDWWIKYFRCFSVISGIAAIVRAMMNGGKDVYANGGSREVKNYDKYEASATVKDFENAEANMVTIVSEKIKGLLEDDTRPNIIRTRISLVSVNKPTIVTSDGKLIPKSTTAPKDEGKDEEEEPLETTPDTSSFSKPFGAEMTKSVLGPKMSPKAKMSKTPVRNMDIEYDGYNQKSAENIALLLGKDLAGFKNDEDGAPFWGFKGVELTKLGWALLSKTAKEKKYILRPTADTRAAFNLE